VRGTPQPELLSHDSERVVRAMDCVKSAVSAQQHAQGGVDVEGGGARDAGGVGGCRVGVDVR
jgi:hypothetical protein